jgi:hypothetical protein
LSARSWRDVPPNGSPSSMDGDYGGTLPLPFSLIRGRPENVAHPLGRSPCFQLPQPGFNRSIHSSSRTLVANAARPSQGKCPTQGPRPTASAHPPELGALRACWHRGSCPTGWCSGDGKRGSVDRKSDGPFTATLILRCRTSTPLVQILSEGLRHRAKRLAVTSNGKGTHGGTHD